MRFLGGSRRPGPEGEQTGLSDSPAVSPSRDSTVLVGLAAITFLVLMIPNFNRAYGYFIDEFYYLACARRLAFGYVDHPSLSPLLLAVSKWFLGTSIPAIRCLPALAVSATVFLTGLIARRLGGRTSAQILAAVAVMSAPTMLVMGGIFTVNAFEILIWVIAVYVLLRILQTGDARRWLVFGVVAGIGLQNKHTMALLGIALVIGLLFIPARRFFLGKWFWLGGGIALCILLPNQLWQVAHGWPSLEFYRNAELYKNVPRRFACSSISSSSTTPRPCLSGSAGSVSI
jgi:4-amino-4-deoxy-L-arabinose transferase-like glycosyltransferase